jgi:DNA (cytosine-5)-methyltransferase 1
MMRTPRFAEFFAGIGLVRLALRPLGWDCVFANDLDARKANVYARNFGPDHLRVCDIREVHPSELPPDLTLLTACFPCIDLSLAGNRAGLAGEHSGTFWPFHSIVKGRVAAGHPAPLILIENVDGFLTSHGGADLESAISALNRTGYRCDVVIVDARRFAPQSRRRLFLIAEHESSPFGVLRPFGVGDDWPSEVRPEKLARFINAHPRLSWGRVDFPALPTTALRLRDIVERVHRSSPTWWSEDRVRRLLGSMQAPSRKRLAALLATRRGGVGTVYRRTREGRSRAELRTDGIAGCLRTTRGGSSKQFLLVARAGRVRVRNMTPTEYARLQGIEDVEGFVHAANPNEALFGFGDAICVPLVRWIARHAFRPAFDRPRTSHKARELDAAIA